MIMLVQMVDHACGGSLRKPSVCFLRKCFNTATENLHVRLGIFACPSNRERYES